MAEASTLKIDQQLVRDVLGLEAGDAFTARQLGWTDSTVAGTLTFLDSERYLPTLLANANVVAAFVTPALREQVAAAGRAVIVSDDPRYDYHVLHNHLAREGKVRWASEVHPDARVHPRAYVAEHNVRIGAGTIVEPNATILEDVEIGRDCVIRAGAVLGSEGYEHKRTSRGIVSVVHDGQVIVGERVEIGSNTCVDKGFRAKPTRIGDDCKIDNLVHIAHSVSIGERSMIVASAMLGGSTVIGDDAWVGPNATVSSVLRIGPRAAVTLGAVVTRDVDADARVSGNFAVPHDRFLAFLKTIR